MFASTDVSNRGQALNLEDLMQVIRRWWWLFIPPLLLCVAAATMLTLRSTELYRAEAEVVIRTEESANLFPLSDAESLLRSPSAEAGFLASTEYEEQAMRAAGSRQSVRLDVGDVTSRVEPSFISFRAVEEDPNLAASTAQAWADTYISMRHARDVSETDQTIGTLQASLDRLVAERSTILLELEPIDRLLATATDANEVTQLTTQRLALLQSLDSILAPIESEMALVNDELAGLRLIENFLSNTNVSARINRVAEAPANPFAPSLPKNLAIGVALGLILGAVAALFAESKDDRVRSSTEIEDRTGLQYLTTVNHIRKDDGALHVVESGHVGESFQRLASAIDFATLGGGANQVLMFTSGRSAEAKTTTTARLGVTLARQGRRTILIGADLRRPTLADRFGNARGPGLGELLSGINNLDECVKATTGYSELRLLPAGSIPDDRSPADLLRGSGLRDLIEHLRGEYDHILIDCPPILPVVDALVVTEVVDGIVFNAFASRTRMKEIGRSMTLIRQATSVPILGYVLTGAKAKAEGYGTGAEYYGKHPGRTGSGKAIASGPVADFVEDPPIDLSVSASTETPEKIYWRPTHIQTPDEARAEYRATSLDQIEFGGDLLEEVEGEFISGAHVENTNKQTKWKVRKMKQIMAATIVGLVVMLLGSTAGAQTYEGTDLESGIFFVPDIPQAGDVVNFAVTGLQPGSDLTFTLVDSNSVEVDGLEVAGAVVLPVSGTGSFNDDIALPDNLPNGTYVLQVTGTNADTSDFYTEWSFVINAALAQDNSDTGDTQPASLALTGNDSGSLAFSGLLLVVLGVGIVTVAAVRRRSSTVEA